jgi:hypothetical protein
MYVIVKMVKNVNGRQLPVIILDSQGEIWEFSNEKDAEKMRVTFENNSDSGHTYFVKKI